MKIKTFDTGGVLIIANITQCLKHYTDKEFNYNYPEGLSALIQQGLVHIVTTDTDIGGLDVVFNENEIDLTKWKSTESNNYIKVAEGDAVLLVSHPQFTQLLDANCIKVNQHEEDLKQVEWLKEMLAKMNKEANVTLESVIKNLEEYAQKKIATILNEKKYQVDVSPGLYKVNVFTHKRKTTFPKFTYFLDKVASVDLDTITLEPLECYV